jgi:glycosyltransferase involved in cell wall biosynthesis
LPLAERVLIYDTGSTDATLDQIASIRSEKIEIVQKRSASPSELCAYRNEMIEQTTTEWFMLVDGDEIYPAHAVRRIAQEIRTVPPAVHRILVHRKHFMGSLNFVSRLDRLGRIYRTSRIRHALYAPEFCDRVGHETPCLRDDPSAAWERYSMVFPKDIVFFHAQYLVRSSKDADLGRSRGWRRPPFPALPYVGPWPETLDLDGVADRMTARLLWDSIGLNARIAGVRGAALAGAPSRAWRIWDRPRRNPVFPEQSSTGAPAP